MTPLEKLWIDTEALRARERARYREQIENAREAPALLSIKYFCPPNFRLYQKPG